MAGKAQPLCETCSLHDGQTRRLAFMWGAMWTGGAIFVVAVTVFYNLIAANTDGIQQTRRVVARNERIMNESVYNIQHTLTIMSINQKRQMEKEGIDYLDPEPIHFGLSED